MASYTKRPKRSTGQYTSNRVLTASSPIVTADIQSFLAMCISGWQENYTEDEKKAIIASLPRRYQRMEYDLNGSVICPLDFGFVHQDTYMKKSISRFRNDVVDGYYGTGWQNQALRARHEKEAGKFDGYLAQKVPDLFGNENDEANHTTLQNETNGVAVGEHPHKGSPSDTALACTAASVDTSRQNPRVS